MSIFWNRSRIYFSFLAYKTLRVIVTLFSQLFSNYLFLMEHLFFFLLYLPIKCLIFVALSRYFLFFHDLMQLLHMLSFLLKRFVVALLFFIQSGESMYDQPWLGFNLWHLYYNKLNKNSLYIINSKLFWHLIFRDSKIIINFSF